MQRLTKYPLLIESLLKHTSRKYCCASRFMELVGCNVRMCCFQSRRLLCLLRYNHVLFVESIIVVPNYVILRMYAFLMPCAGPGCCRISPIHLDFFAYLSFVTVICHCCLCFFCVVTWLQLDRFLVSTTSQCWKSAGMHQNAIPGPVKTDESVPGPINVSFHTGRVVLGPHWCNYTLHAIMFYTTATCWAPDPPDFIVLHQISSWWEDGSLCLPQEPLPTFSLGLSFWLFEP